MPNGHVQLALLVRNDVIEEAFAVRLPGNGAIDEFLDQDEIELSEDAVDCTAHLKLAQHILGNATVTVLRTSNMYASEWATSQFQQGQLRGWGGPLDQQAGESLRPHSSWPRELVYPAVQEECSRCRPLTHRPTRNRGTFSLAAL